MWEPELDFVFQTKTEKAIKDIYIQWEKIQIYTVY